MFVLNVNSHFVPVNFLCNPYGRVQSVISISLHVVLCMTVRVTNTFFFFLLECNEHCNETDKVITTGVTKNKWTCCSETMYNVSIQYQRTTSEENCNLMFFAFLRH